MSDTIILDAELRSDLGKGASRRLRREEKVPAILYGADQAPVSITLDHNKVIKVQEQETFYTQVLTLNLGGEKISALVKDMQRHAFKPKVTHLDFMRVDETHALQTNLPLHFINEDAAAKKGLTVTHVLAEVEVKCLAKDLPEFIEVDLANAAAGTIIHLSDLNTPAGVELVELSKGEGHDQAVVNVYAAHSADEEDGEAESEQA